MLNQNDLTEAHGFLQRLQGQTVRVEICSRINIGFRQSYSVKLQKAADAYNLVSESGEVSMYIDVREAESLSSDNSAVTLLYGDNLVTVRFARKR
jgi:hypothetical protein